MVSDNTSHCFTQIITQLHVYSLNTIGDTSRSNSAENSLEYYTKFLLTSYINAYTLHVDVWKT